MQAAAGSRFVSVELVVSVFFAKWWLAWPLTSSLYDKMCEIVCIHFVTLQSKSFQLVPVVKNYSAFCLWKEMQVLVSSFRTRTWLFSTETVWFVWVLTNWSPFFYSLTRSYIKYEVEVWKLTSVIPLRDQTFQSKSWCFKCDFTHWLFNCGSHWWLYSFWVFFWGTYLSEFMSNSLVLIVTEGKISSLLQKRECDLKMWMRILTHPPWRKRAWSPPCKLLSCGHVAPRSCWWTGAEAKSCWRYGIFTSPSEVSGFLVYHGKSLGSRTEGLLLRHAAANIHLAKVAC